MSKAITLGVQSSDGQKRVSISPIDKTDALYKNVHKAFELNNMQFSLFKDMQKKQPIESSRTKSVSSCGLKHGDRLFLVSKSATLFKPDAGGSSSSSSSSFPTASSSSESAQVKAKAVVVVKEDQIDVELSKIDGKIPRKRDTLHCQHNQNSQCVHCTPFEPFDEEYLKEQKIKHMSFQSFLRMTYKDSGLSKGKFTPLKNMSCAIQLDRGCEHKPWPKGICTKCQPSAVTLSRQNYRHCDNVMFENPHIVDRFLHYWRETGNQRAGWLIGRYEIHHDVPLGVKAVVTAIYEPPQESTRDSLKILPDPKEEVVNEIIKQLGLVKVGWIFSDLVPSSNGKVKHFRNMDSHFLSASEIISAAAYQAQHPNACKMSSDGTFGSKFVTVCATGNKDNEVAMEGYQVSNQCMSLVVENMLIPTRDAPELGYIRESSDEQYVPDVFFMEKDKYGNEIKKVGRPLPVEYLLLDVPVSVPKEENMLYTFTVPASADRTSFPVGNRLIESSHQDFNAFARYMTQFRSAEFLDSVSDLHVLIFMATLEIMPLRDFMGPLIEAILTKNSDAARDWTYSDHWDNVNALIQATTQM